MHTSSSTVQSNFSTLDNFLIVRFVSKTVENEMRAMERTHRKKLQRLGIYNQLQPCDPDKVVHNYSDVKLSTRIRFLLAFGLDFNLPVRKLSLHSLYVPLEKLCYVFSKEKCASRFQDFVRTLKFSTYEVFKNFNPKKVFSPIFTESDLKLLSEFSRNTNIIVSRPDKGRGVVITNKADYIDSISRILSDPSKFEILSEPIRKYCTKMEDKINRFLSQLKKIKCIDEDTYTRLYCSGSAPGIMYGLPKIHKSDFSTKFQFRPILAAYNQASYKISKFLVPILAPLTTNQFTVSNSSEFSRFVSSYDNANDFYMASFDIESLFTLIPLKETIQLCVNKLFSGNQSVPGFTRDLLKKLLEHAVLNSFFLFNGAY